MSSHKRPGLFSPCILVPHFNHVREFRNTLPQLESANHPILVVDDGSDVPVKVALRDLIKKSPSTSLYERRENGGKGAALIQGMKEAQEMHFTHVITIDADGQHNAEDIERFCEIAERNHRSIVCGMPVFGSDIPLSRLYGRKITNALVRWESGVQIPDAMCGFRVYPITETLDICYQIKKRLYMEFEIELLVKACWRKMDLVFVPTSVRYPEGGTSHFRMIRDNLRLAAAHSNLISQRMFAIAMKN